MLLRRNVFGLSGAAGGFSTGGRSPTGGFSTGTVISSATSPAGNTVTLSRGPTSPVTTTLRAALTKAAADAAAGPQYAPVSRGTAAPERGAQPVAPGSATGTQLTFDGGAGGGAAYTLPDGTVIPAEPRGLLAKFSAMSLVGKLAVVGAIGGVGYLGYRFFVKGHGGASGALPKSS